MENWLWMIVVSLWPVAAWYGERRRKYWEERFREK